MVVLYFAGLQDEWLWIAAGLALSLLFGHLSFRWVETPTRISLTAASMRKQVITLGLAGMLIGVAAVSARLFVFEGRLSSELVAVASEAKNIYSKQTQCISASDETNKPVDCNYNDLPLGVISIGDSHNSATFTALASGAERFGYDAMHWARSACPALKGARFQNRAPGCFDFNESAFARLDDEYRGVPVVLVSRLTRALIGSNEEPASKGVPHIYFKEPANDGFSESYQAEFRKAQIETACMLAQQHPVYLVRPIPEMGVHVPNTLVRNMQFRRNKDDIKITLEEYHERHAFVWQAQDMAAEQCGVKILDPLPYLCDEQYCYGSRDGRPLYYDDDHLSEYGNKFLVPMFEQVFRDQQQ